MHMYVYKENFDFIITYLAGVVVDQLGQLLGVEQDIAQKLTVIPYCCPFGQPSSKISVSRELRSRVLCPFKLIKRKLLILIIYLINHIY